MDAASDVLLVSLLDGRVMGLDAANGRILWQFDSGAPLVSVAQSSAGVNIFPGVDGGLYAFNGLDGTQARLAVGGGMPPWLVRTHMLQAANKPSAASSLPSLQLLYVCAPYTRACKKQPTYFSLLVQRLGITLPELVESSPSLADDGSLVLGSRMSTVYALDRATGALMRLVSGVAGTLDANTLEGESERWQCSVSCVERVLNCDACSTRPA